MELHEQIQKEIIRLRNELISLEEENQDLVERVENFNKQREEINRKIMWLEERLKYECGID